MSILRDIKEFYKKMGKRRLEEKFNDPDVLATLIAIYAHRNQLRENGSMYVNHPLNCCGKFVGFLQIEDHEGMLNEETIKILENNEVPYLGVIPVCALHDVIEEGHLTLEEIGEIYEETNNNKEYFEKYIKEPLDIITHKETDTYDEYINKVIENPIASMCKMMDLQDNLHFLTLTYFDESRYERACKYLSYFYKINNKYHFIEKVSAYRNGILNAEKN